MTLDEIEHRWNELLEENPGIATLEVIEKIVNEAEERGRQQGFEELKQDYLRRGY
jgi:hypothetical protein